MRILIFSDIHGNAVGLDALLADTQGESFDQMVCLGDAIQGGPQPQIVVKRLRALGCPVVMGNADDWLLTGQETGGESSDGERQRQLDTVRLWSLAQLSEADLAFIRTFTPTVEIALDQQRTLLCFHGSPHAYDDVILPTTPEADVRNLLVPVESTIYTGGHTHVQFIQHLGRTFHFNPGSVGFAYGHNQVKESTFRANSWAEYAVLTVTEERLALEFRRVPYAAEELIATYRVSNRPFAEVAIAQYSQG